MRCRRAPGYLPPSRHCRASCSPPLCRCRASCNPPAGRRRCLSVFSYPPISCGPLCCSEQALPRLHTPRHLLPFLPTPGLALAAIAFAVAIAAVAIIMSVHDRYMQRFYASMRKRYSSKAGHQSNCNKRRRRCSHSAGQYCRSTLIAGTVKLTENHPETSR